MEFPGFLGNAPVKEALIRAFSAGRFPHALLFHGEKGVGKRTLAALTAKALVCRDPANAPCGVCPSCIRAKAGSHRLQICAANKLFWDEEILFQ